MIKHTQVILTFPLGAQFHDGFSILLYKKLVHYIKDLMCFNISCKCNDCEHHSQCRYYHVFGENFAGYPGIIIKNDLFEKKIYQKGEQRVIDFYFVGDVGLYVDYIEIFFNSLNQKIFGNFFYLNSISTKVIQPSIINHNFVANFSTPIETYETSECYNRMVQYYNQKYNSRFMLMNEVSQIINPKKVEWPILHFVTRTVYVKGYIGKSCMQANVDQRLLTIGIGKFNYIGGGQVESED